jgi:hypothetical protein
MLVPALAAAPTDRQIDGRSGSHRIKAMSNEIHPRKLGNSGPTVFPLALGCMGMSGMYGESDEPESIATIQTALDEEWATMRC